MLTRRACLALPALLALTTATSAAATSAAGAVLLLGSTTTTENSGLLAWLLPKFEAETGIEVRTVVAGTGRVLQLAAAGDIDVSLTHDPVGEQAFIAAGHGLYRHEVMFNDFMLVGPRADPAGIAGMVNPADALRRIAKAGAPFYSRADDSGTHRRELALWGGAPDDWSGYRETGTGMGATLNIAVAADAYTMVDRGTWAAFGNRGTLVVLVEGDATLSNQYGVILPAAIRAENRAAAERLINWLISAPGQAAIAAFRVEGEQVFFPNSTS